MFKNNLKTIEHELNMHKRDKETLLAYHIQARLTKSLEVYYKELEYSVEYLNSKNEYKMAKRLNKD